MSIEAALKRIRVRYADHLLDHRVTLANLIDAAASAPDPAEVIEQIRFRAHKISGTAATLGFHALGETAARCEQDADACLDAQGKVEPVLAAAGHLIGRIDEALQEIA